jgi:hypothetical protein
MSKVGRVLLVVLLLLSVSVPVLAENGPKVPWIESVNFGR